MSNYVIIRNLPMKTVSVDLRYYEIDENIIGFKDFSNNVHYVNVKLKSGNFTGFWFFFKNDDLNDIFGDEHNIIVKRYDAENDIIVDDSEDNISKYRELIASGALNDKLIRVRINKGIPSWNDLTYYIREFEQIPVLQLAEDEQQSFTELFQNVHNSDICSLIAEFQFAFVSMLIGADEGYNQEALKRWAQMMRFICNATLDEVNSRTQFYIEWIDALLEQLQALPTSVFQADDDELLHLIIFGNASSILDTIRTADYNKLRKKGEEYEQYLKERAAGMV